MNDRDQRAKEIAKKTFKASAKIYGTAIGEDQVDRLFELWWKRNGRDIVTQAYQSC